jgi:hypothetical protein
MKCADRPWCFAVPETKLAIYSAEGSFVNTLAESWHSGERIEDDPDLERHEFEQPFHVGQIHHPDMIRVPCFHCSRDRRGRLRHPGHRPPLLADPSHRPCRPLPARAGQRPCDQIVSTEPGQLHRLDHRPDHVVEAPDGGIRGDERTGDLAVNTRRFQLPPCDRLCRHPKHPRCLALRQAEETPDPQDPEALLGEVMRTMALRHLVPARPKDRSCLARHPEEQGALFDPFEHLCSRRARLAQPPEGRPESEAEKVRGAQERGKCRAAMGVAARPGARRPAFRFFSSARCAHVGPLQRSSPIFVTGHSGCVSNQHGQQPLRIEILDAKR